MTRGTGVGWQVAALGLGTALNPLNSTMIAVALVAFRDDFRLDVASVTWVVTAFYLSSAALQPVMGRFADRFGPRRLFVLGMAVVAITCVLAPFAPTFPLVCVARVVMGVGTATAFPAAVSMVTTMTRRAGIPSTRPLAAVQMASTTAATLGPVVGGLLVSGLGWPAIFAINVPLALLSLGAVLWFAPPDGEPERGSLARIVADSDFPGILLFSIALVAGLLALLGSLPSAGWWLLVVALAAAGLFVWRELTFRAPFLDLRRLVRNRALVLIYAGFLVVTALFYSVLYGLPQLLEGYADYDPALVGVLMLPLAAISLVMTPLAARGIGRWGVRRMLVFGTCGVLVAAALLGILTLSLTVALVVILSALLGMPYSVVNITSSQGMYASVDAASRGVAAGILQTSRYLGAIAATALIGLAFGARASPGGWGVLVVGMVVLGAIAALIAFAWRPARASS